MNKKVLGKQYGKLTIRERAALLINAAGRDDLAEVQQLIGSAPRVSLDAPDCGRAVQRLGFWIGYHAVCQLEACGAFLLMAIFEDRKDTKKRRADIRDGCLIAAWSIITRADAWKMVCAELGLDPIGALKMIGLSADSAGPLVMQLAEKIARDFAPTLEEVRDALKRYDGKDSNPRTAETIATEYRNMLDSPALSK